MTKPLNFQSIIMTMQDFWAKQGCLIWQPYYSQVGAGTMNPATALRVLGPEPWNVGYVEPSIRPDDGRYGENPNRMQMHYQFQVILKPDPGNPQEIYLQSLKALGIDHRQHDIRFVEDNWESPALGAWGLGWEVWLDGQEITQFTYFQQSGGVALDPVSVEITYGLERIAIALQQVNSFRDIQWNQDLTDGDVNLQAEQEHCRYYFEVADVERLRQLYDLYEAEAKACIAKGLVLPAHDYVLKCSHTFNVLDARGAVGVTERQALFGRMRDLSRQIADTYLEQRLRLEYPLLRESSETAIQNLSTRPVNASIRSMQLSRQSNITAFPFLFEIGTEELPVCDLDSALQQLKNKVPEMLKTLHLGHGAIDIQGTPRRLVVYIQELSAHQPDLEETFKGPPANRAFDPDGSPTRAAEGFANSKGVSLSDLQIQEIDGGRYVCARVKKEGKDTVDILAESLPGLISGLKFDKTMRWNSNNIQFSRPIRWLLAVLGEGEDSLVVPFEFAGLRSGDITRGLRFREPESIQVRSPADFFNFLSSQGIILDRGFRKSAVLSQVQQLAAEVGGLVPDDPELLVEVTDLVEAPTALRCNFDPSYLNLPHKVLTSVMKKHQRYFPVVPQIQAPNSEKDKDNIRISDPALLPCFIAVRNGNQEGLDIVRDGNEHVIRARFADADFFIREDLKKPLSAYRPALATLIFQTRLGSMLDKTDRITSLVIQLAAQAGVSEEQAATAKRAAELCKLDLVTKMVVEMTSLQGLMGRYYATRAGETPEVSKSIFEHYLPRFTGDILPSSWPGLLVGLADRLDSLVGLFAAGLAPSGNKDPFAQRRSALGLVQLLLGRELDFDLRPALNMAATFQPIVVTEESKKAVLDFIVERLRNFLQDKGARYDSVDAVLAAQGYNPSRAANAVKALDSWKIRSNWPSILPAYARCVRITRDEVERFPVDAKLFSAPEETKLNSALISAESRLLSSGSVDDFLNAFVPMIPIVNEFFDHVLVMAEDRTIRQNRLGILQRIAALADGVADMSCLEGF